MLPLPHIEQLIDEALKSMRNHHRHDLNAGYRRALYAAFGPRHTTEEASSFVGHRCRTVLAITTVRYVLPLWEQTYPTDNRPRRILAYAQQVLDGEPIDEQDYRYFWMSLSWDEESIKYSAIGFASVEAVRVAHDDEHFNLDQVDYSLTDQDIGRWERDTAFYAAMAYCGGPTWVESADDDKRLQFWEWWLHEAIPTACATVTSPS